MKHSILIILLVSLMFGLSAEVIPEQQSAPLIRNALIACTSEALLPPQMRLLSPSASVREKPSPLLYTP